MSVHPGNLQFPSTFEPAGRGPFSQMATAPASPRALAIVVPCYNEELRLDTGVFKAFLNANPMIRMIFVNDGSKDGTLGVLRAIGADFPAQVDVVHLAKNGGKAEAVRQGLLHASQTGAGFVGYWDADLATPLEAIADFAAVAVRYDDVDVIFGSRRVMLGHRIERTLKRRVISRACNMLARVAIRLPVGDTQCGAKLLRNNDLLRQSLVTPFRAGWLFDVELFTRLSGGTGRSKHAFYELPLSEWTEIAGSKVSGRAIVRAGFSMLGLIARNRLGFGACPARVLAGPAVKARFSTSGSVSA